MSPAPPKPPKPIREEAADRPTGDPRPLRREATPGVPTRREAPSDPGDAPTTWVDPQAIAAARRAATPPPLPAPEPPALPAHRASQPDSDHPEDVTRYRLRVVEREVAELGGKVDGVHAELGGVGEELSALRLEVRQARASASSDTVKQIVAGVVAVVTAVVGSRVVAPSPPSAPPPERSAFDRALDACAQLADDKARGACIGRVIDESMPARR